MTRPRLLDLFCGAGGCAVGYHRAGFDVTGVDIEPHPDYPFPIVKADALEILAAPAFLTGFQVIHASPPCPRWSVGTVARGDRDNHPDLLTPTRDLLRAWGGVYVIENVATAPLDNPVLICGWAMGLRHIRRHRRFESNAPLMSPGCLCPHGDTVSIWGHSGEDRRKTTIRDTGKWGHHIPTKEIAALMGVTWMTRRADISDAVPPAYTHHIGEQIAAHLESVP